VRFLGLSPQPSTWCLCGKQTHMQEQGAAATQTSEHVRCALCVGGPCGSFFSLHCRCRSRMPLSPSQGTNLPHSLSISHTGWARGFVLQPRPRGPLIGSHDLPRLHVQSEGPLCMGLAYDRPARTHPANFGTKHRCSGLLQSFNQRADSRTSTHKTCTPQGEAATSLPSPRHRL